MNPPPDADDRKLSIISLEDWSQEWRRFKRSKFYLDITQLSIYILEEITAYLPGRDLGACAAVCYLWREAFNDDMYWRRLCYRDIVTYLEQVDTNVKPRLQLPTHDCDTLEELCEWRVRFMRQAHLVRNWYNMRYKLKTIYTYDSAISHSGHVLKDSGDHWLVISTRSKTQVWDIQKVPFMMAAVVNYGESFVAGVGDLMLRASHNLLEVFSPADLLATQASPDEQQNKFEIKLKFACFINSSERFPKSVETTSDVTKVIARSSRYDFKNPFNYFTIGNIFVGYQPIPSRLWVRPRIHFWDLPSGIKIHDEAVPRVCSFCLVTKGDTVKPLILVYVFKSSTFKNRSIKFSQIYLYNIKTMRYTGFHGNVPAKVVWWGLSNDILVTRHERAFHFFNARSGKYLSVIDMDLKMNLIESDLKNSQFILNGRLFYTSKYYLKVMDMVSLQNVLTMDLNYIIYSLHNIRGRFMIISTKSSSEVWEIETKKVIFKLPYLFVTDFKLITDTCPINLLAQSQNEVSIINFW